MSSAASMLLRVSSTKSGFVDSADIVKPVSRHCHGSCCLGGEVRPLLPQPSHALDQPPRNLRRDHLSTRGFALTIAPAPSTGIATLLKRTLPQQLPSAVRP